MNRKSSFVVMVLVIFVWMLGIKRPLSAAGVVGNGTPGSCTESALTSAISGGGNVTFNCGANPVTITVTSQKTINVDTTIDGGGLVTIDGGNNVRIFTIPNANHLTPGSHLTLQNITVANGYSTGVGGGVYVERWSSLTVENSTFTGNYGHNGGGIGTNGWEGIGATVIVSGSTFTNNVATAPGISGGGNGGGGIYVAGGSTATVTGSTFTNNQASNGGAIHILLSNLLVTNVTFNNNDANNSAGGGGGGAIYMDGTKDMAGEIRVVDSQFNGNMTNQLGGAIFSYPEGTGSAHISTSIFDENVSSNRGMGGGIYHQSANHVALMTIDDTLFVNNRAIATAANQAGQGGAIWSTLATLVVTNSTFTQNSAANMNVLPGDDWHRGFGGAIRTSDNTTILNSTIANNTAGFVGGGLAGEANVKNTIIANNTGDNEWDIQQNCTKVVNNQGGNIQYPQKTTGNWNDYECFGSQTAVDPQLMALGDYGGPTQTMALSGSSPAVNGGVNNGCPSTDQRGYLREDGQCDSGAFELGATADPVITQLVPSFAGVNESGSDKTLTVQGYNFTTDSVVRWNGSGLATTYVSPYVITAVIPAANISATGTAAITVYDSGEDATSNAMTFTIVENVSWVYLPTILK